MQLTRLILSSLLCMGSIGALGIGCATTAPLDTERSTSGIRAAEEVGAAAIPRAALHLQLAKEQLAQAQGLVKEGKNEEAASMLSRSEADAELAVVLSHGAAQKAEADQALERVRELRKANE